MSLIPTLGPNDPESVIVLSSKDIVIELIQPNGKAYLKITDPTNPDFLDYLDFYLAKSVILSLDRSIKKAREEMKKNG